MFYYIIQIFFSIILLVSLVQRIKGDFGVIKEQKGIASKPCLDNFNKTLGESIITTAFTVDDEKFDDNELRKLFIQNFKLYKNLARERNINDAHGTVRKIREATNDTSKKRIECLSCFANGTSASDEDCFKGSTKKTVNCSDGELCFTEFNPGYVKRGCLFYGRLNRTFHCNCHLCNDKPSNDHTYYDYTSYDSWLYDNYFLQKPSKKVDLMCKVCETSGINDVSDKNCRLGKTADYMVCGHNQLCYINIDDEIDHVTRGCKTRPVYNSIYYFCNNTLCNNVYHNIPKSILQKKTLLFGNMKRLSAKNCNDRLQFYNIFAIISLQLFFALARK